AVRPACPNATKTLSTWSATPPLTGFGSLASGGLGLRYRHSSSPVLALSAITWLYDVATNITPLLTVGGAWCPLFIPVDLSHTGCSRLTVAGVIWSSGL